MSMYLSGAHAFLKEALDWDTDTIKVALTTSSYTPNLSTHDNFDDITNEVSGTGYSAGGATLASPTVTGTAANSWSNAWATGTVYAVGYTVRPTAGNGYLYRCSVAGTSHGSTEPTWPTVVGAVVTDNGITWTCVGYAAEVLDAADTSWSTATITARYAVIYKSTGTPSTSRLIFLIDFGSDITSTAGTFLIQWPAQGIHIQFVN